MSDCTGGESNAVVRKRNGKRRFRRAHGTKSANIRRIQKPNLHFGLRGIICAAAALFIAFAILLDSAFSVPLRALAEEKAARLAAELLNSAVLEVMGAYSEKHDPSELAKVQRNESGADILFIDAVKINRLRPNSASGAFKCFCRRITRDGKRNFIVYRKRPSYKRRDFSCGKNRFRTFRCIFSCRNQPNKIFGISKTDCKHSDNTCLI